MSEATPDVAVDPGCVPVDAAAAPDTPTAARWQRDYDRIAQAIRWLDDHRPEQPRLADVAAALDLSPSHLQRTFSRFAGTSPSRFLRWLSASAARDLLRDQATVLDAAAGAGVSSTGRLHDLLITLDAVTPGEVGRGGCGLTIRTGVHATPLGLAAVAVTDRGVLSLTFPDPPQPPAGAEHDDVDVEVLAAAVFDQADAELVAAWPRARLVRDPQATCPAADHLVAALDGAVEGRPLVASVVGTNLQLKVWEALLALPPGRVASYGEVARAAGRPGAVRAVASAVGRNPVAALIPCHRVLRATGALGGYRWGTTRKRMLLAREAARAEA